MGPAVYLLGTLVSLFCAFLLLRGYFQTRKHLLLWSGLCFSGLTVSNALVFVDLIILPEINLYHLRLLIAALAMIVLLYGLIWDSD